MNSTQELQAPELNVAPVAKPLGRVWRWLGMDAQQRRFLLNSFYLALVIRLLLMILAYYSGRTVFKNTDDLWPMIYQVLSRWDTINYYTLASDGYVAYGNNQKLIVFFPVLPWLLRSLSYIAGNPLVPGLIISFVSSVVAGYYLQCLTLLDHDEETAHWALKYFFLFPTAYFLCVPYNEALFLALTLGSWYSARKGHWGIAGVAGLLTSLTRIQGLVLFPALLLEAWLQRRERPWWQMLPVLLVPVGFVLYMGLNWYVLGDPLAFTDMQQRHWGNHMVPPWEPVVNAFKYLLGYAGPTTEQGTNVDIARLVAFFFTIVTLLLGIRRIRLSYQLYAWAQFLMVMLSSWLMSLPRYIICLFPIYIIYASLSRNSEFHFRLSTAFTLMLGGLSFLFAAGYWAF